MKNIGFIGIGLMGFPMAKNLLKSGYNLKAYNRSQDKADRLKEFGAEISLSIKDVVTNADVSYYNAYRRCCSRKSNE